MGLPGSPATDPHPPEPVPDGLDWDMWLGPAPWAPYTKLRCHFDWRWILDYAGGGLTDWGGHHIDIAHWGLGLDHTGPVEVEGSGDYPSDGLWNAPTRYRITCKYADGLTMTVADSSRVARGTKWYGERGWIFVNRETLEAQPESILDEVIGPGEIRLHESHDHKQNLLDSIRSRTLTVTPVEVAHRSISVALLGEIAMLTGRKIRWDPETEEIIDDPGAAALLGRAYREPWHL